MKRNKPSYIELERRIQQLEDEIVRSHENIKYRTIFENSVEGILIIDNTGTIIDWNKFIEEKTGFTKKAAVGRKLWDVQHSVLTEEWKKAYPVDSLQRIWMNLITNLPENETVAKEGQYIGKNGGLVLTEDIICPLILKGEKYLCIVQRDLSERRKAEQELKESEQEFRQLNATKDKLFSIIAHDLRSPFNTILGFSHLLLKNIRKYEVEKTEEFLEAIDSSAQNTLALLDNLLNWAKNQTGQTVFHPDNLKLQDVIQEVLAELKSSALIKNISLNLFLPGDIIIHADHNMLKTILRNLISNAIKFTGSGGKINISAISGSGQVEITISDNGRGIGKAEINDLFTIETKVTAAGNKQVKGSGLGLVICREFVEKHGGKIWVESEVKKGSKFKFTVPTGF